MEKVDNMPEPMDNIRKDRDSKWKKKSKEMLEIKKAVNKNEECIWWAH